LLACLGEGRFLLGVLLADSFDHYYYEEGQKMSKKMVSLFLVLLMVFSATASLAEGSEIVVTDMLGREVTLSEPATRIVVMQPSDCEILCAIDCEEAIVGRGQYVDYMTNHNHVDALSLFRPHYHIPKNIQKYYDTFWSLYEEDRRMCYGENPEPCQI
jgi:hypothetical protein